MIQRIQSLLLFVAGLLSFLVLFVPLWEIQLPGGTQYVIYGMDLKVQEQGSSESVWVTENVLHLGIFIISILIPTYFSFVIFSYKDRIRQMKMTYAGIGLIFIQLLLIVLFSTNIQGAAADTDSTFQFGFFFPIAAVLFAWGAGKRIKKDEELVRSVDRLR